MSTAIDPTIPPSGTGCVECDADSGWWVHLRRCAACGHIGCCDDSLARHASAHWRDSGHPIIRSFEPGEDWFWNYETNEYYDGPELAAPECHPKDQPVPGPAGTSPQRLGQPSYGVAPTAIGYPSGMKKDKPDTAETDVGAPARRMTTSRATLPRGPRRASTGPTRVAPHGGDLPRPTPARRAS